MPNKFNARSRHHIPKVRFRLTNWREYDAGLRRRGDVRFWIEDAALASWQAPRRATPGGQPVYSNLAIEATLILGAAFGLRLRQTQGFVSSLLELLGTDLSAPHHTTLSRRRRTVAVDPRLQARDGPIDVVLDSTGLKIFGPGEWHEDKHGKKRRCWRKLHIALDPKSGEIVAHELTEDNVSDPDRAAPLVAAVGAAVSTVIADGAYDGEPVYDAIRTSRPEETIRIVVPPRKTSGPPGGKPASWTQRQQHAAAIAARGRMAWQKEVGYGKRALVETGIGRYKAIIGAGLHASSLDAQRQEVSVNIAVLNKMNQVAKPNSIRTL